MDAVIDVGRELLVDASRIRDPYLRLLTAAIGETLVRGSPWRAVDKRAAGLCRATRDEASVKTKPAGSEDPAVSVVTPVGVTGFEPATSWSRTKRSTKLSYTPSCGPGEDQPF